MGGYLKSLRRKLGIVTLLTACLFAAAWVRSLRTSDNLLFVLGKIAFDVESKHGSIEFMFHRIFGERVGRILYFQRSRWRSSQLPIQEIRFNAEGISYNAPEFRAWRRQKRLEWGGVEFASGGSVINGSITIDHLYTHFLEINNSKMKNRVETCLIACSYGHLVVPLTLLSACLLLSRPRRLN